MQQPLINFVNLIFFLAAIFFFIFVPIILVFAWRDFKRWVDFQIDEYEEYEEDEYEDEEEEPQPKTKKATSQNRLQEVDEEEDW